MANTGNAQVGISINLGVNGTSSVQDATTQVRQLNNAVNQTGQANVAAPMQTLRQELRSALADTQRLAAAGQQNTQAFRDAATRVQQLRNDIDETNRSIKAFDPDNKFRVFASAASAGAKALQGYTAGLSLLGVDADKSSETLVKLQSVMALADAVDSLDDVRDSFKDLLRLLGLNLTQTVANTTATQANTVANTANATATEAQATAQEANAVATEGATTATEAATVATNTFGTALKAIGIGLIIAALVALWANFDAVKKKIDELFPGLGGVDNLFKNIVQTVYGLGSAVKQTFKGLASAVGDVLTGNFSKIGDDLKNAFDVGDAFRAGVADKIKQDAEDAKTERIKKEIETNTRIIAERKALGQNTYALEVANQKLKIQALDKDAKDYDKQRADAESQLTVLINGETKKRADKAAEIAKAKAEKEKQQRQSDLQSINENNEAALKIIAEGSKEQRNLELTDLDIKYQKEFALLEKRKADIKDYNQEYSNLVEARKNEEVNINKKYDDQINEYLKGTQANAVSVYDKAIEDINKKVDNLLKNATPEEAVALEASRKSQINNQNTLKTADANNKQANKNLASTEDANRPADTDTAEEAALKIANIAKAKTDAENAAFELKKAQLAGQNDELEELSANHEKNLTDIENTNATARKNIAKAEKDAKVALYDEVGQALGAAGKLAGENTVAGKALSVASATVSTYLSAQKAYESQFLPVPSIDSPIRGALAAGVAVATGLANIKQILAVKVPAASGLASVSTGSVPTAPVINSTILQQANNGTQDIVNAVKTDKNQPLRAYIVEKDLQKQADKNKLIESYTKI